MSTPTYTNLDWVPKVDYTNCGSPVSFTFPLPQRPWDLWSSSVGGQDVSDSGVIEAFQIRQDNGRVWRPRFFEDDWPAVQSFWEVVTREGQAFTLTFDQGDATTAETVVIVSPGVGEQLQPTRQAFTDVFEVAITIRESSGTVMADEWDPRS